MNSYYIMKHSTIYILLAIALTLSPSSCDPLGDLTVYATSYTIQQSADYTFVLKFTGDGAKTYTVPIGSQLIIYLPAEYPLLPAQDRVCSIGTWPTSFDQITCVLSYQTLTITNAFTFPLVIGPKSTLTLKWYVMGIKNPTYSQTTGFFSGDIKFDNIAVFARFAPISFLGLTINPGILSVKLSIWPTQADSVSNLSVVVKPTHPIPVNGYLKVKFSSTWSTAHYRSNILNTESACIAINNTKNNLGCTSPSLISQNYILTVINIYQVQSSEQFAFNLTKFTNPPSSQPVGNFIFQTYNSTDTDTAALIDSSSGNFITGVTASPIIFPSLVLSQYEQGSQVQADLTVTIINVIKTTDLIYFEAPAQIDLSTITKVQISSIEATIKTLTTSQLTIKSQIVLDNPYPLTITFNNITLPPYSTIINSPFILYVKRDSYYVCSLSQGFGINITAGQVNVALTTDQNQAGMLANYNFSINSTHQLSPTSKISFYFKPTQFSISSAIGCQSSASTNCTVLSTANNLVEIQWTVLNKSTSVNILLTNVLNPSSIGPFLPITVSTYNLVGGSFYLVDYNQIDAYFSLTARGMLLNNMEVRSDSNIVYALSTYTITIKNNNKVPANSYINVYFPSEIALSGLTCNVSCTPGIINGKTTVKLEKVGQLVAGSTSVFSLKNILNPISTKTTSPFGLQIYSQTNKLLEYLSTGPSIKVTAPSSLSLSISSNSKINSGIANYSITLSTNYAISATVAVVLVMPNVQSCPACASQNANTTHNQFVFYNQPMNGNTLVLNVINITNFDNYQPQTVTSAILSNDLLYNYANGSTTTTTSSPSTPSFLYTFTTYQLYTSTDLIINSITSATLASRVGSIMLQFGSDFDVTMVNCINTVYLCTPSSSQLNLSVIVPGVLSQVIIKNIISPWLPGTSTPIQLSTYSKSNFLIDKNAVITWQPKCQQPCRTCQTSNTSACLSCYSNLTTSAGRTILFTTNGTTAVNTCVSQCGDLYYKNYTTNTCERCSSSCGNCYNYSFCLLCPVGQNLLNQKCYSLCPTGYFAHSSACIACTASRHCYTCADELTCSSCISPYFYYQTTCTLNCPLDTTIKNTTSSTCDPCPTNCTTCQLTNSTVICTSCLSGLLDAGICVQNCITALYVPDGKVCSPCSTNCLTCKTAPDICESCNSSSEYRYLLNNKCYSQCNLTYYNDNNTFKCEKCQLPCETCGSYSSNDCRSCKNGYSLSGTICNSTCPSESYSNLTDCLPCTGSCLTCVSDTLCMTCLTNFLYFTSNYSCLASCPPGYVNVSEICKPCNSNCLTCITLSVCLTCPVNSYLFNGTCLNPCPNSYFPNTTECSACPSSCSLCQNTSHCTSCQSGYQLQTNFSCISLCPTYQIPISGVCVNCTASCSACQISTTNCTACANGYYYAPSLFACFTVCPPQLYYDAASSTCIVSCQSNNYITKNNANNVSSCNPCPDYCSVCLSNTICTACLSGTFFYNNLCYINCPNQALYAFNSICQSCNVVDCQSCSSSDCVACISGKLLIGSQLCISNCSNNQVYNPTNRTCDTVVTVINETNSTNNNNNSNNGDKTNTTIITTVPVDTNINFLPLPFLIVLVLASVLVFILHFKNKISAIPTLYGLIGPLILFCHITVLLLGFTQSLNSFLYKLSLYCLLIGVCLSLIASILSMILWFKYCGSEKWGVAVSNLLHCSVMALLTCNFAQYNSYFKEEHKSFWRRYKILSKVNLVIFVVSGVSGVLLSFGVSSHSSFIYFGAIEVSLLNFLGLIAAILWIWIPLKEPIQQEEYSSEKSTEIIMGSEVDKEDQQQEKEKEKEKEEEQEQDQAKNKSRVSDVKTDGERGSIGKPTRSIKSNYQYNKIHSVVKVENDKILQALKEGLFRKSEKEVLSEIRNSQELNHLDDALQMNKYLNQGEVKQEVNHSNTQSKKEANIFQKEDTEFSEEADNPSPRHSEPSQSNILQNQPKVSPKQPDPQPQTKNKQSDVDSGEIAMYQEPFNSKEFDFQHNIIFQDIEQDNITEYRQEKSDKSEEKPQPLAKDSSLGEIINKKPQVVKVESNDNTSERGFSPMFDRSKSKKPSKITVQQIEDDFIQSRIQLFNEQSSKIKPAYSRQLKKKQTKMSKEISKKDKAIVQQQIIHADLQQILTVQDGGSLEYMEFDQFEEVGGSDKKLKNERVEGDYIMKEKSMPRPGDLLRQASIHYQPGVEKNVPPEQREKERLRRRKNR